MTDQDINNMINLQSDNLHQAHSKKDSFYGPFPDDILQKKQKTKKKKQKNKTEAKQIKKNKIIQQLNQVFLIKDLIG